MTKYYVYDRLLGRYITNDKSNKLKTFDDQSAVEYVGKYAKDYHRQLTDFALISKAEYDANQLMIEPLFESSMIEHVEFLPQNGWMAITTNAIDSLYDAIVVYYKNGMFNDDGYTLNSEVEWAVTEYLPEIKKIVKHYDCVLTDGFEIQTTKQSELKALNQALTQLIQCITAISNTVQYMEKAGLNQ